MGRILGGGEERGERAKRDSKVLNRGAAVYYRLLVVSTMTSHPCCSAPIAIAPSRFSGFAGQGEQCLAQDVVMLSWRFRLLLGPWAPMRRTEAFVVQY